MGLTLLLGVFILGLAIGLPVAVTLGLASMASNGASMGAAIITEASGSTAISSVFLGRRLTS